MNHRIPRLPFDVGAPLLALACTERSGLTPT